jgi:hypothetical protein
MTAGALNTWLDALPRSRLGRLSREVPAFRTCGITGFYVALATLFAGGLVTGRSLLVLALLALVCGLSFFAYAHLRRAVFGRELIVLLEHVWFAQLCAAAALLGLGEPLPPYLDLVAPPLAFFLACGRVGCLMVGCCHGNPSSLGIVYPESHAEDGFPRHLVGVRLFPVALVECVGLVLIGVTGFVALPFAAPGRVFLWLLIGYAVMRFGLEGLRGDRRPHLLGLSQARWMSLAEFALALVLGERWSGRAFGAREISLGALLAALLVGCLALKHALDPRRKLLAPAHLKELRELALAAGAGNGDGAPVARTTSAGVRVAVTAAHAGGAAGRHVSLSLPERGVELALLCELAAAALPEAPAENARLSPRGVLHARLPPYAVAAPPSLEPRPARAAVLRAHAAHAAQQPAAGLVAGEREPRTAADEAPAGREGPRGAYFGYRRRAPRAEA